MVGKADPLRLNVPLVDKSGTPTREFALFLNAVWRKVIAPDPEIPEVPPPPDYELIEEWPIFIPFCEDQTIPLVLNAAVEREWTKIEGIAATGVATVTIYNEATPMAAIDISTVLDEQDFGVDVPAGNTVSIVVTASSGCEDAAIKVTSRRLLVPYVEP